MTRKTKVLGKNAGSTDPQHAKEATSGGGSSSLDLRSSVSDNVSTIRHTQSHGAEASSQQSIQQQNAKESLDSVDIGMRRIQSDFAIFKKGKPRKIGGKNIVEWKEQSDGIAERQLHPTIRLDEHLMAMERQHHPIETETEASGHHPTQTSMNHGNQHQLPLQRQENISQQQVLF